NVLAVIPNDTDSRGLPLAVFFPGTNVATPHGMVRPKPDDPQKLLYTPSAGFSGVDLFSYGIVNDFNRESSATLTVFVNEQNNGAPSAANQAVHLEPGDTLATINLLSGCTDPNGHTLTVAAVGLPQVGTITSWNPTTGAAVYDIGDMHYA